MNIFNSFENHIFSVFKENMLYRSNTQLNFIDKRIVCIAAIALVVFISAYYILNETYKATKLVLALDELSAMMKVGLEKIQNIMAKLFTHSPKEKPDSESLEAPSVSQSLVEDLSQSFMEEEDWSSSEILNYCKTHGKKLEHLNLGDTNLNADQIEKICKFCPKLKTFEWHFWGINDTCLEKLTVLESLESLDLSGDPENVHELMEGCNNITNDGFKHFKAFKKLKVLNVRGFDQITNEALKHLSVVINLESLNLGLCNNITDDGIEYLTALLNLISLNLENLDKITNKTLKHLKVLVKLKSLNIINCPNINSSTIKKRLF